MTWLRRISDAIQRHEYERDDQRFLEALEIVMNRAREEFACPLCASGMVTVSGINDSDVEGHVVAECRCANCGSQHGQLAHHFLAAAAHAVTSFDTIDMHMAAKEAGVLPDADDDQQ